MITDEQLLESYHNGFIPYENESPQSFLQREAYCLHSKELIAQMMDQDHSAEKLELQTLPQKFLVEAKKIYGISPGWIPLLVSSEKFLPWQGAATWIMQLKDNDPLTAMIQIPPKSSVFGSTEELVTHEIAHIGRMGFEEKKFEEMIAYASSSKSWRRFWGPLFQSSRETIMFVSLLALVVVFDFGLLFSGSVGWYDRFMWMKLIPALYFSYLVFRLFRHQKIFKKTVSLLSLPLTYLLIDNEIMSYSRQTYEMIKEDILQKKSVSLRRRLLALLIKDHPSN